MLQAVKAKHAQAVPPKMFGWASVDCPTVSAISAPVNSPLTMQVYLAYLTDRVRKMLREEMSEREALGYLSSQLQQADLLDEAPNLSDPDEALNQMIFSNPKLHERLSSLGAFPGKLTLSRNSLRAVQIVEETSLEQWISALTQGTDEHLM